MWPNPRIPFQMSSERPRLEPIGGKPLMVNPVVNIEYWPFDRAMPRGWEGRAGAEVAPLARWPRRPVQPVPDHVGADRWRGSRWRLIPQ
jgi:hypothetical protein